MRKNLLKELERLHKADVIDAEVLASVKAFYAIDQSRSTNRLLTVFSILGGCLIGLGIILLIAHNWDELSRTLKTIFALLPLLIGQGVCFYVLRKQSTSKAWSEGSSSFLFFAVGASIALISQIYNIPGNLGNYLFTWMILSLPIVYVMHSSMVSLLYLIGISWFVGESAYWSYSDTSVYFYWLLLVAVLPDYYLLLKKSPTSHFTKLYSWFIPLSLTFALGSIHSSNEEWLFVAYMALFSVLYQIGAWSWIDKGNSGTNAFKTIASIGSLVVLIMLSFDWLWKDLQKKGLEIDQLFWSLELILTLVLTCIALLLSWYRRQGKNLSFHPLNCLHLVFLVAFVMAYFSAFTTQILINVFALALGIYYVVIGSKLVHLKQLNFGLLIITALVVSRFFDSNITFVVRGLLFICIGLGFFFLNYRLIKKRQHDK